MGLRRRERQGRRFYLLELEAGDILLRGADAGVLWIAWDKFERVSGVASTWEMAEDAIAHFRDAEHTYSLATSGRRATMPAYGTS